jgi:rRNA maturation endonuclease Nob1
MTSSWRSNPVHILRVERLAHQAALPATHKPADRKCLRCQKLFTSRWIGNRICTECGGEGAKKARRVSA